LVTRAISFTTPLASTARHLVEGERDARRVEAVVLERQKMAYTRRLKE
jgi:hypothetical protein